MDSLLHLVKALAAEGELLLDGWICMSLLYLCFALPANLCLATSIK